MEDNRIGLILMLLREGSTRQAIMAYQEEAAVDFETAREQVLELAREHGTPVVRRRFLFPLALLALASLLGLILSH